MTLLEKQLIVKVHNMERTLSRVQQGQYAAALLEEIGHSDTLSRVEQIILLLNIPITIKYRCLRNAISDK